MRKERMCIQYIDRLCIGAKGHTKETTPRVTHLAESPHFCLAAESSLETLRAAHDHDACHPLPRLFPSVHRGEVAYQRTPPLRFVYE